MMLRQGWGMRPSGLRGNGFVGRDPLATGEAIGYDVVGIEGLVEFALLAVAQDGGFDGGERRGVVSGGEEVCHDLRPAGFGESAGFPLMDEGAESGVGGEEWVGWKHGLLFSRIGGNRNFTEVRHTFKPWGMEERERLGFEIVAAVERACASLARSGGRRVVSREQGAQLAADRPG